MRHAQPAHIAYCHPKDTPGTDTSVFDPVIYVVPSKDTALCLTVPVSHIMSCTIVPLAGAHCRLHRVSIRTSQTETTAIPAEYRVLAGSRNVCPDFAHLSRFPLGPPKQPSFSCHPVHLTELRCTHKCPRASTSFSQGIMHTGDLIQVCQVWGIL